MKLNQHTVASNPTTEYPPLSSTPMLKFQRHSSGPYFTYLDTKSTYCSLRDHPYLHFPPSPLHLQHHQFTVYYLSLEASTLFCAAMRQNPLLYTPALLAAISGVASQGQPWKDQDLHQTLLPTAAPPDDPEDSYACVFSNASQYFDPPQPTASLKTAFWDYGDELVAKCVNDGGRVEECWPQKDQWCALTTKAPATLTSALSDWASSATAWWAVHSSDAVEVAVECPQNWFNAMMDLAVNRQWLNLTIAWSACDEKQEAPVSSSQPASSTPAPGSTGQNDRVAATGVPGGSGSFRRVETWKIAGGGVAAAIAHAAL